VTHTVIFTQQSPEHEAGAWQCSGCGLLWELTDNVQPSEHDMFFCPRCGGRIAGENAWEEEPEYTTFHDICTAFAEFLDALPVRLTEINESMKQFFIDVGKALSRIAARKAGE
jgi:uncharacterized paraquat-inducible protein A